MRTYVVCFLLCVAATVPEPTAIAQAPEVTRVDQITKSITATTYSAAPSIEDRDFWTRVGRSTNYQSVVRDADHLATRTFAPLPDELYLEYSQIGNRSRYEKVYFAKLKAFRTLVIAECMQNDGQFIDAIQQAIVSYSADKSWVLPAHDSSNDNFKGRRITVDLFSSEVACELASADYMLGDRLDTATRSLVRKEVKRRIFVPFTQMVTTGTPRMWWLTGTNNWNSVCLANVTGTAATCRVFHDEAGSTYALGNALLYDVEVPANTTLFVEAGSAFAGLTLQATDTLGVRTGTADALTFSAYGTRETAR